MNPTVYLYDYSAWNSPSIGTPSEGKPLQPAGWFDEPHLSLIEARRAYLKAENPSVLSETREIPRTQHVWMRRMGMALLVVALGGLVGPLSPMLRLETGLTFTKATTSIKHFGDLTKPALPPSVPVVFEPLMTPDGGSINPVSQEFSIVVPKIGINAKVMANVDPAKPAEYIEALKTGVAHASTSFLPDQNGTVYIFSHSTNYDWCVKDLNAVCYHLKNLDKGDLIVVIYKGNRYTYKLTDKKVVQPRDITYLVPDVGKNTLVLQTCWPPGSVAERLLIFADLVKEVGKQI
jgi:LPXTG-site transpeptidase (sortase) family protein